jgi:hypothetical protein
VIDRPDFAALNRAAAEEMRRRHSPRAAEAMERRRLANPTPPWERSAEPAVAPPPERDPARYPSEQWQRIPVDEVRYPGLTRPRARVRRFQLETPAYRRQFNAVNRAACATLVVVPPVCWVLMGGQTLSPIGAAMIGWTTAAIGAVRMLLFVTRQRHTA